ncbi:hypothetical protein G6F55_013866 [Rhizopus delemar]|nr:hypothetical protein G6F55_013866 [Rhizopus delemar]
MVAVGGAGGDPRTDRTGFVDAFLQDLALAVFALPTCRNMPSMPNVRDSSGTLGTTRGPTSGSFSNSASTRTNAIVVENSRPSLPFRCEANASSAGVASGPGPAGRRGRWPPAPAMAA